MLAEIPVDELASAIQDTMNAGLKAINLIMPKFSISTGIEDLAGHLKGMGLSKLFTRGECDFGDMFEMVGAHPGSYDWSIRSMNACLRQHIHSMIHN